MEGTIPMLFMELQAFVPFTSKRSDNMSYTNLIIGTFIIFLAFKFHIRDTLFWLSPKSLLKINIT